MENEVQKAEIEQLQYEKCVVDSDVLLERLAALEHERWSHWMRWMFANWTEENIARWKWQMETPYAQLPEHSKDSDRKEARNTLAVFRKATKVAKLNKGGQ